MIVLYLNIVFKSATVFIYVIVSPDIITPEEKDICKLILNFCYGCYSQRVSCAYKSEFYMKDHLVRIKAIVALNCHNTTKQFGVVENFKLDLWGVNTFCLMKENVIFDLCPNCPNFVFRGKKKWTRHLQRVFSLSE